MLKVQSIHLDKSYLYKATFFKNVDQIFPIFDHLSTPVDTVILSKIDKVNKNICLLFGLMHASL